VSLVRDPSGAVSTGATWPRRGVLVAAGHVALALVLLRCAWVCDDAYISFRTVDNMVHGYGARWNVDERVQSFTSPLWVALCVPVHALAPDLYYGAIALSLALALGAATLVARLARDTATALAALAALALSKAWVDYAVSGLENPLAAVLLAAFALAWLRGRPDALQVAGAARASTESRPVVLGLLASAIMLTRHDLVLLVAPALLARVGRPPRATAARGIAAGLVPFVAWEVVSVLYYGVPFPNTAWAKLATGVPLPDLARQGALYFVDLARLGPLTAAVVGAGLLVAAGRRATRPLGLGLALHLAYILRIGGDFMSGRFFTAPFVVALAVLARRGLPENRAARLAAAVVIALLGAGSPRSPLWSGVTYGQADPERPESWHGIADERAVYYQETGLLPALRRGGPALAHRWAAEGMAARAEGVRFVRRTGIGFYGFFAGPGVHVLDPHALADPLLARLPASTARGFRIGHFPRPSPVGYEETLRTGENRIADPDLAAYWDVLRMVTRDLVLDPDRIRTVVAFNLGHYEHLRRAYVERAAREKERRLRAREAVVREPG